VPEAPPQGARAWIAFLAGVVATLAVVLAWWALSSGRRAADEVRIVTPLPSDLPRPRLPEEPRLPDAPIPKPR